jgi:hypothetical protein
MSGFFIFKCMFVVLFLQTLASSGDPVVLSSTIEGLLQTLKSLNLALHLLGFGFCSYSLLLIEVMQSSFV